MWQLFPTDRSQTLSHFSKRRKLAPRSVEQLQPGDPKYRGDKPYGLWLSVDEQYDWAEWCRDENFIDTDRQYCFDVVLAPDARLLWLSSAEDIDSFTEEYRGEETFDSSYMLGTWTMDWAKVAARWQGIVISPYQWSRRLTGIARWFYGWDCASGCIWDASAIAEVSLTRGPIRVKEREEAV